MIDLSWKMAYKNLLRNKRRSLATGIAIAFGFNGLILLGAYIHRVQNFLLSNAVYMKYQGHISFYKSNALEKYYSNPKKYLFTPEEQAQVHSLLAPWQNEIEFISPKLSGVGMIAKDNRSTPFVALGIEPRLDKFVREHPYARQWTPDFINNENGDLYTASAADPSTISITALMARIINLSIAENSYTQLTAKNFYGDLNAVNATARLSHSTGVELLEDISLVTSLSLLQDLYATDGVSDLAVYLYHSGQAEKIAAQLRDTIKARSWPFEVYPFTDEKISPIYTGTLSFLNVMAVFFSTLILAVVCLSVVNSITMGILERVREIGTLRAIGYKPAGVTLLFVKESLLLTFFSAIIGLVLAIGISLIVNSMNIKYRPPATAAPVQFLLIPHTWLCVFVALAFLTLTYVTSYWVAFKKTQKPIVELLTETGA